MMTVARGVSVEPDDNGAAVVRPATCTPSVRSKMATLLPRELQAEVAVVVGVVEPFGRDLDVEEEVDAALQ